MLDNLSALNDCIRDRLPAVWVTVARVRGSTPREAGTKMLVTQGTLYGTIGGGNLEFEAIRIARELLAATPPQNNPSLHRFPLGPSLGQCCGGVAELLFESVRQPPSWLAALNRLSKTQSPFVMVTPVMQAATTEPWQKLLVTASDYLGQWPDTALQTQALLQARKLLQGGAAQWLSLGSSLQALFEPVQATDFHIELYGAGHVGKALVHVLSTLPCRIRWVDSRAEQFPATVPATVECLLSDAPELEADDAPAGSYVLVMTHSHPLDQAICERFLRRGGYRYLGLIGSASKKRKFEQRLRRAGISAEQWATLTCPIGIADIDGKQPAEIAVAVAAQLLQLRHTAAMPAINPVNAPV